jgi:hypothetical protein
MVVNATPKLLYPRERNSVPIVQEAGWAPARVWVGAEILPPPPQPPPGFDPQTAQPAASRYKHKHIVKQKCEVLL